MPPLMTNVSAGKSRSSCSHDLVAQWRQLSIFLGRQAFEPGVACMHDEHIAPGFGHRADKVAHEGVVLAAIDADAVLHRHRQVHGVAHRGHAVMHQRRLSHQARTKRAALHALARAAAIQVHFVITPLLCEFGARREVCRLAAAELQGNRMFLGIEVQMPRHVAMEQGAAGHHLGVQARALRDLAMEVAAMAVGPVHHRRDGQAPSTRSLC